MALLKASLPLRARTTPRRVALLQERSPACKFPLACDVVEVFYAGDEGGILCTLDLGDRAATDVHIVSISHLAFDRTVPMAPDIEAYQRHRIKKIRRQTGRGT